MNMGWFACSKGDFVADGSVEEAIRIPNVRFPNVETSTQHRPAIDPLPHNPQIGPHFRSEINPCQSWFHVKDPVNGRLSNIPETFAPASGYAFLCKVTFLSICVLTLIWCNIHGGDPGFYFAYFTNWGVLWCNVYACMSLLNTVLASRTEQPAADKPVGCRIRLTWILLTAAAHNTAMASILFWPVVFDRENHTTYATVAPHGFLTLLVMADGSYVNRIPLRWMHYFGVALPIALLFTLWSYLHDVLKIGNPDNNDSDPTTNDDAIYENVLEWNHHWTTALTCTVVAMFFLGPIVFGLLWLLSTGCCCCNDTRRYVDDVDPTDDRPTVYDVEEGSS
jgi:hypothetical protein